MSEARLRAGFVVEHTLGHVTHYQNMRRQAETEPDISADWMLIRPSEQDRWSRNPIISSNWSLLGSLRARDAVQACTLGRRLDCLFVHTQTLTLFLSEPMRRIPTVVSLDATPRNFDTVGAAYGHRPCHVPGIEAAKHAWIKKALHWPRQLVTWCQWAKASLVRDYEVPAESIHVIPPGIDLEAWAPPPSRRSRRRPRLLFVGGDFARKGGECLLNAYRSRLYRLADLDVVTSDRAAASAMAAIPGVTVHTGLQANSAALRNLYASAELFVFPTRGDCLPMAIMEALAAGLPVVASRIGAIPEQVVEGENGLLVPPGHPEALADAAERLLCDESTRLRMGEASRDRAESMFDARRNYAALLAVLRQTASGQAGNRMLAGP